jgi:hypothetical protein
MRGKVSPRARNTAATMEIGKSLRATTRKAWRTWLQKNHARKKEIWLVYPLKHTGKRRLPYNDAVEEALCFGWIDSIIKKLDAGVASLGHYRRGTRCAAVHSATQREERSLRDQQGTSASSDSRRADDARGSSQDSNPDG